MNLTSRQRVLALSIALAYPLGQPLAAWAADATTATATELQKVEVTGTRSRLDAARNGLSPDTGSSITRLDKKDIQNLPQGENTPLNQVILQTPGVVQDSYGQLHVRGDHGNVQYRINGVVIPESISGFGQALETRFADRMSILTGALPAQYGYRTAAIVDITTKGENEQQDAGSIGVTLGGKGTAETNIELNGTKGPLSYYLTGSYDTNKLGIENPTSDKDALHDKTKQAKAFGYLSYLLDDDSRVTAMFGTTNNRFQIPNVPGQAPDFTTDAAPPKDSALLDANQRETNRFGVLSYQGSAGLSVDYQVSLFHRTTDVHYQPDPIGDLQYNGIAADILRRNVASGIQADMSWRLNSAHTVRAGLFGQHEKVTSNNNALVFPADADGNPDQRRAAEHPGRRRPQRQPLGRLPAGRMEGQPGADRQLRPALRPGQDRRQREPVEPAPGPGLQADAGPRPARRLLPATSPPPPTEKIDTTSIQKFLGTTNALPSDANTAVKAERSNYYDAGLAWAATPQLTLGIDGYYRDIRHLQDEGQFGNALIFSAFNFAKGRIYGLDLSANYKDKAFSAYMNLGFAHARGTQIETGQFNFDDDELAFIQSNWVHLDHEQSLSASAGANYRFANGVALSGSALYGSGLRDGFANTEHLPSYTTFNGDVSKSFDFGGAMGKVETRLSVINLFDRVHQLRDGTGIGVGAPQYGQRRTLYVALNKSF